MRANWTTLLYIALLGFFSESVTGLAFYQTSFLIDELIAGDTTDGLLYAAGASAALLATLMTRHVYQL